MIITTGIDEDYDDNDLIPEDSGSARDRRDGEMDEEKNGGGIRCVN